ncbi:MAG TPA: SDR family oxidoreductase [Oculatellaceae cyanobacterium]|jgi:3-oxoacyl-[acyl-carrier protein] reductase
MGLLQGKKAFISGGSRGLGKALCEVFAREGADVAFNYHSNDEAAADTVRAIEKHGAKALAFKVSVTDKVGIKHMVAEILENFGRIDILVNNAAINKADSFVTTTEKAWLNIIDTNVNGLYYTTKPFFKQMMRQRSGNILNITSIGAIRALPTSVHYATAKAAVLGFTKCLSREAGPFGIVVNGIAAGIFDTDLGHSLPERFRGMYEKWSMKGRFGRPEELAEFAAFMVSDRNTYMMGEIVTLDGGAVV